MTLPGAMVLMITQWASLQLFLSSTEKRFSLCVAMETLDPMLHLELMVDFPASHSLLVIAGPQLVILSWLLEFLSSASQSERWCSLGASSSADVQLWLQRHCP